MSSLQIYSSLLRLDLQYRNNIVKRVIEIVGFWYGLRLHARSAKTICFYELCFYESPYFLEGNDVGICFSVF